MDHWVSQNTDLLALALAFLGSLVSLVTIGLNARQARLNAYTRIHEALVSPAVARGRRALFQAHAKGELPDVEDPAWDEINQALALYDTLGVYVQRHIVPRRLTLATWRAPLRAIAGPAEAWLAHRAARGHHNPWPHLTWLLDAAARGAHSRR